jgi:nucleoside-diphosphate-sugar epimerase
MTITLSPPLATKDLRHVVSLVAEADWESLRGKCIFLTGGTGFVGKWLLSTLIEAERTYSLKCKVLLLTRSTPVFQRQAPHLASADSVRLIEGDVRNFCFLDEKIDYVIHAATDVVAKSTPLQVFESCVIGTRRVLEFATQVGCSGLMFIGSGAIYGRQPSSLNGMTESYNGSPELYRPETAYGQSKRISEWLVNAVAAEHGMRVVTARLFTFYGPYLALDKQFAIGNFLRDAMAGGPIVLQGDGTTVRSYLYAADMAGWLWNIFFRGVPGTAYNVGDGEGISMLELASKIALATGSKEGIDIRGETTIGRAPERYVPDVTRAHEELGLSRLIALEDGLRRTVEWYGISA